MPTYNSKCQECGKVHTYVARIANYNTAMPMCCGQQSKRHITAQSIPSFTTSVTRFESYQCPVTDQIVTSARQKRYIEDSNDLVIKEKGMTKKEHRVAKDETPDELKPHLQRMTDEFNAKQNF